MEAQFDRVIPEIHISDFKKFNIGCTKTQCSDNLHCFKMTKKDIKKHKTIGVCKECGVNLIDWDRVHQNDSKDAQFILNSMKLEYIRHAFWHAIIDKKAIEKAQKQGLLKLKERTFKRIKSSIGKAQNYREGKQTPIGGDEIIHYAQHATATCCRKCLEYWHNIKMGTELSDEQITFCTELAMLYIEERVPYITELGVKQKENVY